MLQHVEIMKIIKTVFFTICLTLFSAITALAQSIPPPPDDPDDPDILPIDDHLMLLLAAGMILGIVFIYRNKIKKASI